jgi:anti-anti-sigma factor
LKRVDLLDSRQSPQILEVGVSKPMLNVSVQNFDGATILRCQGRIVAGDENIILRDAVVSHADTGMLVLDLLQVDRIDAGGLGLLLSLLAWTRSRGIQLRLANLTRRVRDLFKLTRLDQVFTISSVDEMCAASSSPLCEANTRDSMSSSVRHAN